MPHSLSMDYQMNRIAHLFKLVNSLDLGSTSKRNTVLLISILGISQKNGWKQICLHPCYLFTFLLPCEQRYQHRVPQPESKSHQDCPAQCPIGIGHYDAQPEDCVVPFGEAIVLIALLAQIDGDHKRVRVYREGEESRDVTEFQEFPDEAIADKLVLDVLDSLESEPVFFQPIVQP